MNYPAYSDAETVWEAAELGVGRQVAETAAWPLAAEVREMLGDECELDASFFEDRWRFGVESVARDRRGQPSAAQTKSGCSFAELDGWNAWTWVYAQVAEGTPLQTTGSAVSAAGGWAGIFKAREDVTDGGCQDEPNVAEDEAFTVMHPTTVEHACSLLKLHVGSAEPEIKAAYRRLVHQWHPDRFARGDEFEQERANERMATINDAYRIARRALDVV